MPTAGRESWFFKRFRLLREDHATYDTLLQGEEEFDEALEPAFDLALEEERFEDAYEVGGDILKAYEKSGAPEFDPNTGVMLLKMGKLALYLVSLLAMLSAFQTYSTVDFILYK